MIELRLLIQCLLLTILGVTAKAADVFNGSPLPGGILDLSSNGNSPTFLAFSAGHNIVEGSMGWNGSALDADIWTFTIDPGFELSSIKLSSYNGTNPTAPNGHWMALAAGNTIDMTQTVDHLSNGLWRNETDLAGNSITDLLGILQNGPEYGGIGFSGNLQAGSYTFWVQDTSDLVNQYCIDFVVTPVPEPGSVILAGLATVFCLRRHRPRKEAA